MESRIFLSESEVAQRRLEEKTLKIARHLFEVHGYLKIDNLFSVEFIQTLASSLVSQLQFDEIEGHLKSGSQVSHQRYIVPIPFKPPFNDPELYAHPVLLSLMKEFLGPHCILSSLGSVVSLPGATDQHVHADYLPLFEESPELTGTYPSYAITVAVPLVDIDLLNGPTKIWSGSHRIYPIDSEMRSYYRHLLCGVMGSCYFWDYRTIHAGGSNHSETIRPLLYMGYTRRWFKDLLNPDQLKIEEGEFQQIPKEHHKLFTSGHAQTFLRN